MSHQANRSKRDHEHGYKAVLCREETKDQLRKMRNSLSDRDLFQERRLVTAAIEIMLEDVQSNSQALNRLLSQARKVVEKDLYDQTHKEE